MRAASRIAVATISIITTIHQTKLNVPTSLIEKESTFLSISMHAVSYRERKGLVKSSLKMVRKREIVIISD